MISSLGFVTIAFDLFVGSVIAMGGIINNKVANELIYKNPNIVVNRNINNELTFLKQLIWLNKFWAESFELTSVAHPRYCGLCFSRFVTD